MAILVMSSLGTKYDSRYAEAGECRDHFRVNQWPRNRYEAICFVPGSGDVVLDVGCGEGYVLNAMSSRYRQLIGTELSAVRLDRAKCTLNGKKFRGVLVEDDRLDGIESESVDRVVSSDVIEHIVDVYTHIAEIYRVLKPGGDLVINTPNIATINKRVQLLRGRFPATSAANEGLADRHIYDGGHLHYFTFSSLAGLLERSQYRVIARLGFGRFGRVHHVWPTLLSGSVQIHAVKVAIVDS